MLHAQGDIPLPLALVTRWRAAGSAGQGAIIQERRRMPKYQSTIERVSPGQGYRAQPNIRARSRVAAWGGRGDTLPVLRHEVV
jgi:hypothetical protein